MHWTLKVSTAVFVIIYLLIISWMLYSQNNRYR